MQVIYEDNHIIAINKEIGEIVQSENPEDQPLENKVKAYIKAKYDKKGDVFLGVVHRIDQPVSGVVLFARTSKALVRLNEMFKEKTVKKIYWAIVKNKPEADSGTLVNYIRRNQNQNKSYVANSEKDGAKKASLAYNLIGASKNYFLLEIELHTGRHHQIRAQLAFIKSPIRGDLKYGYERSNTDGGINLHARSIGFVHPVSKQPIEIVAPLPHDNMWRMFEGVKLD